MKWLYVIHSAHFDINGADTLYKFGMTTRIHARKFDSCYTTAFRYPCKYVKYWELITNEPLDLIESLVKRELREFGKNKTCELSYCGTEMFACYLDTIVETVRNVLAQIKKLSTMEYIEYSEDKFDKKPSGPEPKPGSSEVNSISYSDYDLKNWLSILEIKRNISKSILLTKTQLDILHALHWTFDHHPSEKEGRCCWCNKPLNKSFKIYNEKWGICAYIGSSCIKNINNENLTYAKKNVYDHIANIANNDAIKIIKESDAGIDNIVNDKMEFVYNYYMRDNTDATSDAGINKISSKKLLDILRSIDKFDPRGTICKIIVWMIDNNHTIISRDKIKNMIWSWNNNLNMMWNIEVVEMYISQNECRLQIRQDVFILKKYYLQEYKFKNIIDSIKNQKPYSMPSSENKFEHALKKFSNDHEFQMDDDEFRKRIDFRACFDKSNICLLRGCAGSGKSTVAAILAHCEYEARAQIIQMAPTGKAVHVINKKNVEVNKKCTYQATTIHQFLYSNKIHINKRNVFVHIDECSMIDTSLFCDLLNKLVMLPRVKILLTGDENQIQPVGFGNPFSYVIKTLNNINTNSIYLNTSFRLKTGVLDVVANFEKRRDNQKYTLIPHLFADIEHSPDVMVTYTTYNTSTIKMLSAHKFKFLTYRKKDCDMINSIINNNRSITNFKRGDNIMIVKNGYETHSSTLMYYNGQEYKFGSYDAKKHTLTCTDAEGKKNIINIAESHKKMRIDKLITMSDCITIHKSQGSEYNKVCLFLGDCDIPDYRLIYTAITRSIAHLVIMHFSAAHLNVNIMKKLKENYNTY